MRGKTTYHRSILETQTWLDTIEFYRKPTKGHIIPVVQRRDSRPSHPGRRSQIPYQREEFAKREHRQKTDFERMTAPQDGIMTGTAQDTIDEMPGMDRMEFESIEYIAVGGNLFKMRDSVADAKDMDVMCGGGIDLDTIRPLNQEEQILQMIDRKDADWSRMKREKDDNIELENAWSMYAPALLSYLLDSIPDSPFSEVSPALLEPGGQIAEVDIPEGDQRSFVLLHGAVELTVDDSEKQQSRILIQTHQVITIHGPCHILLIPVEGEEDDCLVAVARIDMTTPADDMLAKAMSSTTGYDNIERVSDTPAPLLDDAEEPEEEYAEFFPDDLESWDAPLPSLGGRGPRIKSGILPNITELGQDIPKDPEVRSLLWHRETAGSISIEEWQVRKKLRRLEDELTIRLDSAYIGRGYIPPRVRWARIIEDQPSLPAEAKEDRIEYAQGLHRTAKNVRTLPAEQEFRQRIRPLNQADRAIANKWSPNPIKERIANQWVEKPAPLAVQMAEFTELLSSKKILQLRCKMCNTTFRHSPKYDVYEAVYNFVTGQNGYEIHTDEDGKIFRIPDKPMYYEATPKCWRCRYSEFEVLVEESLSAVTQILQGGRKTIVDNVLRKKVWHWFERRRKYSPAVYKYRLRCRSCSRLHDRIAPVKQLKSITCLSCEVQGTAVRPRENMPPLVKGHSSKAQFLILKQMKMKDASKQTDSRWWRDRTEEFRTLSCTAPQWNTIYAQLAIQKNRITRSYLDRKDQLPGERSIAWQNDRDAAWAKLKDAFQQTETKEDIQRFEQMAWQQKIAAFRDSKKRIKGGDILELSLIDQVRFADEDRIKQAVAAKKTKIKDSKVANNILQLKEIFYLVPASTCARAEECPTICLGKDSLETICHHCKTKTVKDSKQFITATRVEGQPHFGVIDKDDRGFLYIPCTNCGAKVVIGSKDVRYLEDVCTYND
jgi:hypothetical protein